MKLEVIATGRDTATRPTPLLLIHGAWHGAWCWQGGFSDALAAAGYAVYAVSLRGHGGSDGRARLRTTRIADYVADVLAVCATLPAAPVLVAHSMGGLVAQKVAERAPTPALALLASVPSHGALPITLRVARHHPLVFARMNAKMSLYPVVETPALAREYLFSANTPQEIVAAVQPRLQDESYFAFLDMILNLARPGRISAPVRVLGGAEDNIFHPGEVAATARAYHTTATLYPGRGHNLMHEPGWEEVAADVVAWLDGLGL